MLCIVKLDKLIPLSLMKGVWKCQSCHYRELGSSYRKTLRLQGPEQFAEIALFRRVARRCECQNQLATHRDVYFVNVLIGNSIAGRYLHDRQIKWLDF